jgi:hypothetical protein
MNRCKECGCDLTGFSPVEAYCWNCHPLRAVREEEVRQQKVRRFRKVYRQEFARKRQKVY